MVQLSLQRAFDLAAANLRVSNKGAEVDERMHKRRKCRVDDNGLCCALLSEHRCHCRCGCSAYSKEHVRCVHCQNYIIDNSTACQCSFYVHPVTDDAICHMCHKERYPTFSGVELPHSQDEERRQTEQHIHHRSPSHFSAVMAACRSQKITFEDVSDQTTDLRASVGVKRKPLVSNSATARQSGHGRPWQRQNGRLHRNRDNEISISLGS